MVAWHITERPSLGRSEPGVGLRRLESLVMTGACLSIREDRVVLYEISRESRDLGGCVISQEDFRSVRKESVSIEEWMVGGSGVGLTVW